MPPDVLFACVGGVLADIMDRRRLLIIVKGCLTLIGLAFTLLAITGQTSLNQAAWRKYDRLV